MGISLVISPELLQALSHYNAAFDAYKDATGNYERHHKEKQALWDEHKILVAQLQMGYDETVFKRWQEVTAVLYQNDEHVYAPQYRARQALYEAQTTLYKLFAKEHMRQDEVDALRL